MDYIYKVKVSGNRELFFRELTLEEYKNLQKICVESDLQIFKTFVDQMIPKLCSSNCEDLNLIDIFNILLSIRMYSVLDEKGFTTYVNGKAGTLSINIQNLIDSVSNEYDKSSDTKYTHIDIDDFELADSVLIDIFDSNRIVSFKKGESVYEVSKDIEDFIPISIKNEIDYKVYDCVNKFSDIVLLELVDETGKNIIIKFKLNEDFVYDFCRVIMKDDLKSFYQNIYDLKAHANIGFNEHKYMTYSEMMLYINLFNKQQEKEQQKSNNKNQFPV